MKPEYIEAFMCAPTAAQLWVDITNRYGQSSGPVVYELKRDVLQITQGNSSIVKFFTKFKKIWDELESLNGVPVCECKGCKCALSDKIQNRDEKARLNQLLMRLND